MMVKNLALKQWKPVANAVVNLKRYFRDLFQQYIETFVKSLRLTVSQTLRLLIVKGTDPEQLQAFSNRLVLQ